MPPRGALRRGAKHAEREGFIVRPRGSGATERTRRLPTRREPRGRAGRRRNEPPTRPPPKEGARRWESEERGDRGSGRSERSERGERRGERASGREEAPADERERERERRDARDRTRATSAKRERQRRGNHERGERGRRPEGERSACGESSEKEETKRRERNANGAPARRGRPRGERDLTRTAEGTREGRKAEPRTAEIATALRYSEGASGASARRWFVAALVSVRYPNEIAAATAIFPSHRTEITPAILCWGCIGGTVALRWGEHWSIFNVHINSSRA